jgi:hypothetical protein
MNSILNIQVSAVKSVKNKYTSNPISLASLLNIIKSGESYLGCNLKELILKIRERKAQGLDVKEEKLKLPAIRVGIAQKQGVRKTAAGILTGLISFDIDHVGSDNITNAISLLANHLSVKPIAIFRSPSGDGLKVIYSTNLKRINSKLGEPDFKVAFRKIGKEINKTLKDLNVFVDPAPSNPSSSFFVSYDPNLYLNDSPSIVELETLEDQTNVFSSSVKKTTPLLPKKSLLNKETSSIKPSIDQFEDAVSVLQNKKKEEKAKSLINDYLNTPVGVGARYNQFFKSAIGLARLGLDEKELHHILDLLDYDKSRNLKEVLNSIKKYSKNKAISQSDDFIKNISNMKAREVVYINSWVQEDSSKIIESINTNKITLLNAPTGTGKTSFCINDLPKLFFGRIFFALPLISLREQLDQKTNNTQILRDGDKLDHRAKIIISSYEKMSTVLDQIGSSDLLIIDEVHLLASPTFRSNTSSLLFTHIANANHKTLILSATSIELSPIFNKVLPSFYSIEIKQQYRKNFDLQVFQTKDVFSTTMKQVLLFHKEHPNEKILVFKDNIQDLYLYQQELEKHHINSCVLTSSTKDSPFFHDVIHGKITVPIVLASSVIAVGVNLKAIDKIIISGKVTTSEVVQIGDRNRKNHHSVEMIVSSQRNKKNDFVQCMDNDYFDSYLSKVEAWHNNEKTRIGFVYNDSPTYYDLTAYIKALDNTLSSSSLSKTLTVDRKQGLIINIQGIIANTYQQEITNESDWNYYLSKLKMVYNLNIEVQKVESQKKVEKPKKKKIWNELQLKANKLKNNDVMDPLLVNDWLDDLEIKEHQKNEIFASIEYRMKFLTDNQLSVKDYLFVQDFKQIEYLASCVSSPELHPIENAVIDHLVQNNQQVLFIQDMRNILSNLNLASVHCEHQKQELASYNDENISKFFRRFLCIAANSKRKKTDGRQARCITLSSLIPQWNSLIYVATTKQVS